jgi:hypothetical protein
MALAFVLGGAAVGVAVYLGMRNPAPAPAAAAQSPAPAAALAPSVALPVEAAPAPPAVEKPAPPAPVRKPQPAHKAAHRKAPEPVETAKADPPIPAPPPHVPVIAPAQPVASTPAGAAVHEPAPAAKTEVPKPAPRQPKTVTIPAGTLITVRLRDSLNTERNTLDENFTATLDAPLIVDGFVIAERGSTQRGRIVELERSGRVKGRAMLALALTQLSTADGQHIEIRTDTFRREAESGVKGDAAKAGVAAGIGAAIGAIAGGGKGAGIGAVIGGAAGAGGAMATRGKPVDLPSETRLTFRLSEPITITEKLN